MRFAKIRREGYPRDAICRVVKHGQTESVVELPSGEKVTLYTAFLHQDGEVIRHTAAARNNQGKSFLDKHPVRKR